MAKVYFSKNFEDMIGRLDLSHLGKRVAIKTHFGEQGCTTFLDPALVHRVYDAVAASGREAALVECNVLYRGSRTNSTDHVATARAHGFDRPIDILDGENGQEVVEYDGCKFGRGIEKYDSLLVLSHFKGHVAAGFGGAIKNVSMGLASRAGKLDMHAGMTPFISDACIGCGICVENCNAGSISLEAGKARIDQAACEGCAMCIAVCPSEAVSIPWKGRTEEELQRRMAEYAKALLERFPRTLYISALKDITKHCDCRGESQTPVMADVGYLYAEDIVSIDAASLDLANRYSDNKFDAINKVDKQRQIALAREAGLGDGEYELIGI